MIVKKYKMLDGTDYRGLDPQGNHLVKIIIRVDNEDWAYGEFTETTNDFIVVPQEELEANDLVKYFTPIVPASISRRQAKQQLSADGKLALVQPMIDAITDLKARELVQIYWDDSTDFDRDHPTLIQFAYGLGLTDEELDIMFINANKR